MLLKYLIIRGTFFEMKIISYINDALNLAFSFKFCQIMCIILWINFLDLFSVWLPSYKKASGFYIGVFNFCHNILPNIINIHKDTYDYS